jgi:hypothetical protein
LSSGILNVDLKLPRDGGGATIRVGCGKVIQYLDIVQNTAFAKRLTHPIEKFDVTSSGIN